MTWQESEENNHDVNNFTRQLLLRPLKALQTYIFLLILKIFNLCNKSCNENLNKFTVKRKGLFDIYLVHHHTP